MHYDNGVVEVARLDSSETKICVLRFQAQSDFCQSCSSSNLRSRSKTLVETYLDTRENGKLNSLQCHSGKGLNSGAAQVLNTDNWRSIQHEMPIMPWSRQSRRLGLESRVFGPLPNQQRTGNFGQEFSK